MGKALHYPLKIFQSAHYLFLPFLKLFFTGSMIAILTSETHLSEARKAFHVDSRVDSRCS